MPDELDSKAFSISLMSHCLPEKQPWLSGDGTSKKRGLKVNCGEGCTFFNSAEADDCLLLTLADRLAAVFLPLKNPLDIRVSSSDLPLCNVLTECLRLPGLEDEQLLAADKLMEAKEPRESRPSGVAASTSEEPVNVDTGLVLCDASVCASSDARDVQLSLDLFRDPLLSPSRSPRRMYRSFCRLDSYPCLI